MGDLKIAPLDRSYVKGAVALHRSARPWIYRGKENGAVLWAFYDAHANREKTVGAVAVRGGKVIGAICGATDLRGAEEWLKRRRRFRAVYVGASGGPDWARGGWPPGEVAPQDNAMAFIVLINRADEFDDAGLRSLINAWVAAAASRGAGRVYAPSTETSGALERFGFRKKTGFWVRLP